MIFAQQILLGDWERDGRTVEMFEEGEAEIWWAGKQMEQVNPFLTSASHRTASIFTRE
jgi:hypothetical protein